MKYPGSELEAPINNFCALCRSVEYSGYRPQGPQGAATNADSKMRCNFTDFTNTTISLLYGSHGPANKEPQTKLNIFYYFL